jgi:DMSO/TMAO reductase YedYZ molybdopterin-dependent catalytic subunit
MELPRVDLRNDIHCVTAWSKFDNDWQGVRVTDVLRQVELLRDARFVTVHGGGGYTSNLTLEDLVREENLFAHSHNGRPLTPEHGWPLRLVVPHLYFWKSVKWVQGLTFEATEEPGFWESYGYHMRGDPWKQERYD